MIPGWRFILTDEVPIDTSHRNGHYAPFTLGKNWMFCQDELGAKHVRYHAEPACHLPTARGDPYDYLVDVLQRVGQHPKPAFAITNLRRDFGRRSSLTIRCGCALHNLRA